MAGLHVSPGRFAGTKVVSAYQSLLTVIARLVHSRTRELDVK